MPGFHLVAPCGALCFVIFMAGANAEIVWDYSPEAVGAPPTGNPTSYSNSTDSQNFAERVDFRWPVELTGMDIFGGFTVDVGELATIRIWSDFRGLPNQLLHEFTSPLTSVDEDGIGAVLNINRKHTDFSTPVALLPFHRYWIGMSGTSTDFTQMAFYIDPPDDGQMAIFYGDDPDAYTEGDMAFRLFGTIADTDSDGVPNDEDNCLQSPNQAQRDTDGDGIGNSCDADLNNNCVVDFADLGEFVSQLFSSGDDADLDGNGIVDFGDLAIVRSSFFGKPGPSAILNTCDAPPAISFDSLPDTPVSGTISVAVTASDDFEVLVVRFLVDGQLLGVDLAPPFSIPWDTLQVLDGPHEVTAEAEDAVGNVSVTMPATVEVSNGIALLWDYSPAGTGATSNVTGWANYSESDNYAETIAFRWPVEVTAMDVYSVDSNGVVGDTAVVRVWSDAYGLSGNLLEEFTVSISVIDFEGTGPVANVTRKHVDFETPLTLEPFRDYWIGMSGVDGDYGTVMGLNGNPPGDGRMTRFRGTQPRYLSLSGDMAFRLLGAVVDDDADGIGNSDDNCIDLANPEQADTDDDGIGNLCDADLDNDCAVTFVDLSIVTDALFTTDPAADINGDGQVDLADLAILRAQFFGKPGPSALANACDVAPSVALVEPAGSPLAGLVQVSAAAGDDFGVLAVRFRVDGEQIVTLTEAPFAFEWDTRDVLDGVRMLTAEAEDAVGNLTVSEAVPVLIDNGLAALWDFSPETLGMPHWTTVNISNESNSQNFADKIRFDTDVSIRGMDLYCVGFTGFVGNPATVRVWSDDNGVPGPLMQEFTETISRVDLDGVGVLPTATRKHIDFATPLLVPADTELWIGMSGGPGFPLAATVYVAPPPGDGESARFNGTEFDRLELGDVSVRLIGSQAAAAPGIATPSPAVESRCVRSFTVPRTSSRSARTMLNEVRPMPCSDGVGPR